MTLQKKLKRTTSGRVWKCVSSGRIQVGFEPRPTEKKVPMKPFVLLTDDDLLIPSPTGRQSTHSEPMPNRTVRSHSHKQEKPTRVRTVLNEKQLHTLRTCYNANPRPDALMKEQLVEMTSLSPRVIRVWFQNKRCKDKKRSILMKQMAEQSANKVRHF